MDNDAKEANTSPAPVTPGMHVELELVSRSGETQRLAVTIVPDAQADFTAGFLGAGTPLANAILGQTVGSLVPYPVADMRSVRILAASASGQTPAEAIAARREAVLRDATEKAQFIEAQIFASSVDTKWGDYDVDGLDPKKWASEN
jgi:hypothetical protein